VPRLEPYNDPAFLVDHKAVQVADQSHDGQFAHPAFGTGFCEECHAWAAVDGCSPDVFELCVG